MSVVAGPFPTADPVGHLGAALTLTSADAARAAVILGASHLVALHVRGWAHFSEGPDAIGSAFAQARIADKLTNPVPGETAHWSTARAPGLHCDSRHTSPEQLGSRKGQTEIRE